MTGHRMIVATAGHVDHGKTTLVRALTGIDTDRLPEEKARRISIDIGFACWDSPLGHAIGFVDFPSQTRFLCDLIPGVHTVDIALFVVASDDGPMAEAGGPAMDAGTWYVLRASERSEVPGNTNQGSEGVEWIAGFRVTLSGSICFPCRNWRFGFQHWCGGHYRRSLILNPAVTRSSRADLADTKAAGGG